MDNDEIDASEPSSSHIDEHSLDRSSPENFLAPDESSSLRIDSSDDLEPLHQINKDGHDSDNENEDIQSNYIEPHSVKLLDYFTAEQSLICDELSEQKKYEYNDQSLNDADIDGSQPGCSSSSGSVNISNFRYLENENVQAVSEALICGDNDTIDNFAHSSREDESTSKAADSNCLENYKKLGNKSLFKSKGKKTFRAVPLRIDHNIDDVEDPSVNNDHEFVLNALVQSSNRYSLFAKADSKVNISNLHLYDSDSSVDDINILESQPALTSSVQSQGSSLRNLPSMSSFLHEDESFMVASSSEEIGQMNDILHLQSPITPGDACLVSSSTGQLDSFPPTPLQFQENDASHSSLSSSPIHPPVLDSTVDSTSGQNISSPYLAESDDEIEAAIPDLNMNMLKTEIRNEISTSGSDANDQEVEDNDNVSLQVLNESQVIDVSQNNHRDSDFIAQYMTIDSLHSNSMIDDHKEQSDGEATALIPTSSAYIPELVDIPGTSGVSTRDKEPSENSIAISSLCPVAESVAQLEVDASIVTGSSTSSLCQERIIELDLSGMEPESSDVVASTASFDDEEFPSDTDENSLKHAVSNFKSSSTLTQLNQHYIMDIGETSLSSDSLPESTCDVNTSSIQLDVRECIGEVSDGDDESPNFQASAELGLGPQQLRDFSGSQCEPQSLVPPPHLLDECHQMETSSNIDLIQCDHSLDAEVVPLPNCVPLLIKEVPPFSICASTLKSSASVEFRNITPFCSKEENLSRPSMAKKSFCKNKIKNFTSRKYLPDTFVKIDSSAITNESKSGQSASLECERDLMDLRRLNLCKLDTLEQPTQTPIKKPFSLLNYAKNTNKASVSNIPINMHSLFGSKKSKANQCSKWPTASTAEDSQACNTDTAKITPASFTHSTPKFFESLFHKPSFKTQTDSNLIEEENIKNELAMDHNMPCSRSILNIVHSESSIDYDVNKSEVQQTCHTPNSLFLEKPVSPCMENICVADKADLDDQKEISVLNLELDGPSVTSEDSGFWCSDCEKILKTKCSIHRVQTIMDKPILSRAWASLPVQHLLIKQVSNGNDIAHGVFARKFIPKRTQFGPLEGIFCKDQPVHFSLVFPCLQNKSIGFMDISDEDSSNWMRFVRPAVAYIEMNCVVVEEDELIYFHTMANIIPKTELRVGYSKQFAMKYNLVTLSPSDEEQKILERLRKSWSCFECDDCFETSSELQKHLTTHDKKMTIEKRPKKRGRGKRTKQNEEFPLNLSHNKKIKVDEGGNEVQDLAKLCERNTLEKAIFECALCPLCFNNEKLLQYHSMYHNAEGSSTSRNDSIPNGKLSSNFDVKGTENLDDDSFSCPICSKTFQSIQEIGRHVKKYSFIVSKSKTAQNSFKCELCYKSFCTQERLNSHAEAHKNESEKPFPCYHCMRRFCNKSALGSHSKFHSEEKESVKVYDCPICREKLLTVHELKLHIPKHCIDGCYTCPTCNKKFPMYFQIRRHIRSYHSDLTFTCPDCGMEKPSYQKLTIHMATHSDEREFGCPVCPKRFKRKDKMKEHLKRIHTHKKEPKNGLKSIPKMNPNDYKKFIYKCDRCLLGFKRRGMLVNHFSKRHPEIPISSIPELNQPILQTCRTYHCQYCKKAYLSATKRNLHILKIHPGEEMVSHNQDDDTTNMKRITRRTYAASCPWCPRQYMTKAKLLQHQRSHHPRHVQISKDKKNSEKLPSHSSDSCMPSNSLVTSEDASISLNLRDLEERIENGVVPHDQESNNSNDDVQVPKERFSLNVNHDNLILKNHVVKTDNRSLQSLHLSEPVVMNVSNTPSLITNFLSSSHNGTQPYIVLTPDGSDAYTLSFRHGSSPNAVIGNYSVLPSETKKETGILPTPLNELDIAGPSQEQGSPLDMRSSRSKNINAIEGSSTQIIVRSPSSENAATQPYSLEFEGLKTDILTQRGGENSLVVCQPFLSFTSSTY